MSILEKIFNTLVLYQYNMRALHWKVKGLDFDNAHGLADEYAKKLDGFIDEVAEILMMIGKEPKNLKTVVASTESDPNEGYLLVSCDNGSYYTKEQMLASIVQMFTHLIRLYDAASKEQVIPEDIISKLQEHQYYFRLECDYKSKNRLANDPKPAAPIMVISSESANVLNEGLRDFFAKVKEQRAKSKAYNAKYKEWYKKAQEQGKKFFPALTKEDVDAFYKADTQSKVFEKHPNDLKKMYDEVNENYKNKNFIDEQMPIMKYWLTVYKPMYQRLCVNK